ncbi:hypothetical protein [Cryobacterium zhongshanensis]|uniref:Uncharacterized protein n=1 Tax=Cryobacterium zhongshanensis TaxID=2928153 RepID=A0AA41UH58_9MICO|nr:hypothetical protein [Cryobacterium zhongshanensis]MCI4659570.1 hypothetical protein [Cryobacterium zhongshanensis]
MAETLFPTRQRCKTCSKKLGGPGVAVYLGLHCSPRCAGLAEPHQDAATAPRECKTERNSHWEFKRRYRSFSEIPNNLREDPSTSWYWCGHCGSLHIGHSRIDLTRESHRVLGDREALSDLLVKSRGHATLKQVAEVAKIRPIRLKELEDPLSLKFDANALFAVLGVYRLKLAAVLREAPAGRKY